MTRSPPNALLGALEPRVSSGPAAVTTAGGECARLAERFGLDLDGWQRLVLDRALGERQDGRWAAFEVGLLVPRQNGKGSVLEARELAGLFLFGERLLTHSAHEAKTSKAHFERMETLLRAGGYDDSKVIFKRSNQEVSIQVRSTGAKLQFFTRTADGGRGLGGDFVALDEAYALTDDQMAALMPTMAARSMHGNPQLWYTSSAGFPKSLVLGRLRERGMAGEPRLCFLDYSAGPDADLDDREAWAQANPGLGIRIGEDFVAAERNSMSDEVFARERLGIWHDPKTVSPIPLDAWRTRVDEDSRIGRDLVLAVSSTIDRADTSVAVCGANLDGVPHFEVAAMGRGVAWAADWLIERNRTLNPLAIVIDPSSPEGALIPVLQEAGIEPWLLSTREVTQACGLIFDSVTSPEVNVVHPGQTELLTALEGSRKRPVGQSGGWAWGRKDGTVDISPLVAVTNALYAWTSRAAKAPKKRTGKVW